jgi:hypothetical protein
MALTADEAKELIQKAFHPRLCEMAGGKDDSDPILFTVIGSTGAGIRNGIIPRSEYETRDLLEKRLATERKALDGG